MWYRNAWIRRRARRMHKYHPYIAMRDCIRTAVEDYGYVV